MWSELRRKLFHLTSLIYVVGLIYIPRKTYAVVLGSLCVAVFLVETARLKNPNWQARIHRIFGALMRAKEEKKYSGLFWMLVGVTITVVLVPDVPVAASALLYLILGDAMAALVGLRFQGPYWPGRDKRIGGSAACFVTCFLVGAVLLASPYGWRGVWAGAVTATIVELGVVPLDDNITIPVASSLVLMLCYGLTPGF